MQAVSPGYSKIKAALPEGRFYVCTKLWKKSENILTAGNGGRSRDRTYDLTIKSRLLYQLSYAPV